MSAASDTVIHRLFAQAKRSPNLPAYYDKRGGSWRATSWSDYASQVRRAAKALIALGQPDGGTVSILGYNRPEWVIMDLAAMAAGGATAGIYTTCSAAEVRYIVAHAQSRVALVENRAQFEKIASTWSEIPDLAFVVTMRGAEPIDDPRVLSWEAFLAKGDSVPDADLDARVDRLKPDKLAILIYTSGTTGPPKAVMLSHENIAWTGKMAQQYNDIGPGDSLLSYLPLSHVAEQTFSVVIPITAGSTIYFAESIEKVPDNLKEVQPTLFCGVPRIWEKFKEGVSAKFALAKGVKKVLLDQALSVGAQVTALRCQGKEPTGLLALRYALMHKLVLSKIKAALGLSRARICVSSAAPIGRDVLDFFAALDILVLEVYGQSEDSGPTSMNQHGATKLGTVGRPFPGVEVKIAPDGEILVRGPNVFLGYYKEPEATAETLIDGWLHSGDLGAFDADGYLSITGRKKEIIITAGGKNIAPKNIEAGLKTHPIIGDAVIIGDRRKFLTALVTLNPEVAKQFAAEHGLPLDGLHEATQVRAAVQRAVDEVNRDLARVETVKKFTILPRSFSVETGELTPTLKIRRRKVNENFAPQIEAMYDEG